MKIALAHDSFTQMGGAERIIEVLHEIFPNAPVFTLVFEPKFSQKYKGWDIRTSKLQALYLSVGQLQYCLPLIPWAVDKLNFSGFDAVISSSSGFIKNIRVPKNCVHINYCHTPTRFLWQDEGYLRQEVPKVLLPIGRFILSAMKKWDYRRAQRVTYFIANSKEVQQRIKQFYNRESKIIYPSVDESFWRPTVLKGDYFLVAGRLQAHKYNDIIVKIFNELGLPLHVVGTGRQEKYLRSIAKQNITFLGRISDERLRDEYSGALGFIYPQTEDFGLMPLEAAACGTATLAFAKGGALETVVPNVTGGLFETYNKENLKQKILGWQAEKYQQENLIAQANKFNKERFKSEILQFIKSHENRG